MREHLQLDPAQVVGTNVEATAALTDGSVELSMTGIRILSLIDHRLIVQEVRIIEERLSPQDLIEENFFSDLDTDEDPYCSQHYMAELVGFAKSYHEAGVEEREKIANAALMAHRASVEKISVVEGEIQQSKLVKELGKSAAKQKQEN